VQAAASRPAKTGLRFWEFSPEAQTMAQARWEGARAGSESPSGPARPSATDGAGAGYPTSGRGAFCGPAAALRRGFLPGAFSAIENPPRVIISTCIL
jgi:hypothetical protein